MSSVILMKYGLIMMLQSLTKKTITSTNGTILNITKELRLFGKHPILAAFV
ncbi:hypothetical protein [Prevotella ihumii]|uniref:hypothetical protein n=1 Tax=Prevotella ihumii TaxID=1917878 RepID=UPI0012B57653|nr:hypothetical protein [Prevotella ihumii]